MNRQTWNLLGVVSSLAVLAVAACSTDDTSGTSTGSTTGTSTGTSSGTSTGTSAGTGTGTSSCDGCYSCGPYALACATQCPEGDPRDLLCDSSFPVSMALNECICDPERGACDELCGATCALNVGGGGAGTGGAGQGGDADGCMACQSAAVQASAPCVSEFNACMTDIDCHP